MRYAELLLKEYDRLGHSARAALDKGSTKRQLVAAYKRFLKQPHPVNTSRFPKTLPGSLLDLYCWHNGGGAELVPYFHFTSFESAHNSWDLTSESAEDGIIYRNGNAIYAETSPFPFLNFNNSDFIVMDVGQDSPTRGSIGTFVVSGTSTVRNEFATLSKFFRAHYRCCKENVYFVDDVGLEFKGERKTLAQFRTDNVQMTNGASIGW